MTGSPVLHEGSVAHNLDPFGTVATETCAARQRAPAGGSIATAASIVTLF